MFRALQDFNERLDLVVAESTFYSYRTTAFRVAARHWITFLFSPLAWLFTNDKYSGKEFLLKSKAPLLVIHDESDQAVPFAAGEDVFNIAVAPKLFWKLNRGGHAAGVAGPSAPLTADYARLLDQLGTVTSPFAKP